MAITTGKNKSYGPPLVNQKYAPLLNIDFQAADRPTYNALLNNRFNLVQRAGLRSGGLDLAVPDWPTAIAAERAVGRLPPLVVVSSNRSKWIKAGLDAAAAQLAALGQAAFPNECDLNALTALRRQKVSPPLYAPVRIGANRGVYIVVHMAEYKLYKTTLANTNITPVGWQFKRGGGGPRGIELAGFGATRFAAMELCKQLYSDTPGNVGNPPWSRAWLLDDNVVAITAFAGFAAIEGDAEDGDVASGFSGGTKAEDQTTNQAWAVKEVAAGRAGPQPIKDSEPPGILQQTALWNVEYFAENYLNFSPSYIASAEDLSITNYFDVEEIPYKFYKGNTVAKELPTYDNQGGANKVNKARAAVTSWFAAAESASPPSPPPPPVRIKPRDDKDGGEQTLGQFIVRRVLPNSLMSESAHKVPVQEAAKCQAVEQMTCGAIAEGYATDALGNTFRINGGANQTVVRSSVP